MEEIRVPLEAVRVLTDSSGDPKLPVKIVCLLVGTVVTLGALETFKNPAVVVNNFCEVFDPIGSVERIVRVEACWVRLFLCVELSFSERLRVQF